MAIALNAVVHWCNDLLLCRNQVSHLLGMSSSRFQVGLAANSLALAFTVSAEGLYAL